MPLGPCPQKYWSSSAMKYFSDVTLDARPDRWYPNSPCKVSLKEPNQIEPTQNSSHCCVDIPTDMNLVCRSITDDTWQTSCIPAQSHILNKGGHEPAIILFASQLPALLSVEWCCTIQQQEHRADLKPRCNTTCISTLQ